MNKQTIKILDGVEASLKWLGIILLGITLWPFAVGTYMSEILVDKKHFVTVGDRYIVLSTLLVLVFGIFGSLLWFAGLLAFFT